LPQPEVFGTQDPAQYADEVTQRCGGTDAGRQARRRTTAYAKQDWPAIKDSATARS
jgi:MerR family transcriptional regulator, thiopeptide resistance regulator